MYNLYHTERRERGKSDEREGGLEIKEKREKEVIPDIELRGSEPCLWEKAIQDRDVSLSRVDRSRYIKLVLISFVNPHSLAVSNGRSFR